MALYFVPIIHLFCLLICGLHGVIMLTAKPFSKHEGRAANGMNLDGCGILVSTLSVVHFDL